MKVGFFGLAIVLVMSLFLWVGIGGSATYYVDKDSVGGTCSNSNAGTLITAPWCTIAKANSTLATGDTVYIRVGTYSESVAPSNSGSNGSPITYARYGTERVIVDGSTQVSTWTLYNGNIYQASLTFSPSLSFWSGGQSSMCTVGHGGYIAQDWAALDYCMGADLASVTGAGKYFVNDSGGCSVGSPCTLYVWLRDIGGKGVNPNNYEMRVGNSRQFLSPTTYNVIDGIEFRGASDNVLFKSVANLTIRNSKFYSNHTTGIYLIEGSSDFLIEQNEFWDNSHCAIELSGVTTGIVQRNRFRKVDNGNGYGGNGGGLMIGIDTGSQIVPSYYVTSQNNVFEPTGFDSNFKQSAIRVYGDNNFIYHNTVYCSVLGMYQMQAGANNTFKNNIGHHVGDNTGAVIFVSAAAYASGGHVFQYNNFYSEDTMGAYIWNGIFNASDTISDWDSHINGVNGMVATNNIGTNPLFVNTATYNLHLTSTSPAIDTGTNAGVQVDIEGNQRPQGSGYDMGAYEFIPK